MAKKQPVTKQTPSITAEQLAQLREILPNVFTEGKVDFDKLHAALGDFGNENPERYSFSWAGKRDSIRILQTPSRATLIPARNESIDFDKTQNIFIEGDNLEVLKLLYKPYFGQVKMIYIDPPYNTGNDFVYPDNFADPLDTYLKLTGQKDSAGNLLTSNAETSGRYHSAWLSMMYPRLFLARQLLRDDGVIFVSIDDKEAYNLRSVMNEVFGEENFIAQFVWEKMYTTKNDATQASISHEYVLLYAKNSNECNISLLPRTLEMDARYKNPDKDSRSVWKAIPMYAAGERKNGRYKITSPSGKTFEPLPNQHWRYRKEDVEKLIKDNRIYFGKDGSTAPNLKRFLSEVQQGIKVKTLWEHSDVGSNDSAKREMKSLFSDMDEILFSFPKPTTLINRMLKLCTEDEDIVLDFFAGSATTAQAVLELSREDGGNRRFILVQLPEPTGNKEFPTIAEIGKERIRRVIKKVKKEREGQLKLDKPEDLGFKVFKLHESNYKQWDGTETKDAKAYAKQMEMLADPLVNGWKEEDVIYEVAVKEGYGLNVVFQDTFAKGVQKITDVDKGQSFYISLADKIKLRDLKSLELKKDDLFICRDIALDDETAANLSLQCRLKTI